MDNAFSYFFEVLLAAVFGWLWWRDYKSHAVGKTADNSAAPANSAAPEKPFFSGATRCAVGFVVLAAAGGVALTLLETAGECALGISAQQKNVPVAALATFLAASVIEEIVFRGWLVVESRGRAALLASIFGVSVFFALGHDFLWQFSLEKDVPWWEFWRGFSTNFSLKGWYSFGAVFVASIYFFAVRFCPQNPLRSLLPCFAAHAARNAAVFAIKLAQGHVVGAW
jgi:membrane protease YdiL (CAAX protease family)